MRVRAIHPHFSLDGALHERGSEYELTGDELAFRLKDQIVAEVHVAAPVHSDAVDAKIAETPLAEPEE